jgi:hypothetical protein
MEHKLKAVGLFAIGGAVAGAGLALGLGLKTLAWGAAFGLGLGFTLGVATQRPPQPRLVNGGFRRLR